MAPNFIDDPAAAIFINTICIAGFALLDIVYVGLNSLSVIPLIVTIFNRLGLVVGWYCVNPLDRNGNPGRKSTSVLFCLYIIYAGGELAYDYFIVERLLPAISVGGVV